MAKHAEPGVRLLRVGEQIRHALADILMRGDIEDPDLVGVSVSVNEVRVSPDLRHATVFVSALAGQKEATLTKALARHQGELRHQLGKRVRIKYLPALKFKLDESFDEASRIEALLHDPKVRRDLD